MNSRRIVLVLLGSMIGGSISSQVYCDETWNVKLYDADPEHLWNRLHQHLFVRKDGRGNLVGHDEVDPLFWYDTKHLLKGQSLKAAHWMLDDLANREGHALVRDPLKRAIFQHDLWFLFDWLALDDDFGRKMLRPVVAKAIRKLALTKEQIAALPDTYQLAVKSEVFPKSFDAAMSDQSFLPPNLFDEKGPWVCLHRSGSKNIAARLHVSLLGGRSLFLVLIRFPGDDRQETLAYLKQLNLFEKPILLVDKPIGHIIGPDRRTPHRGSTIRVNPDLPQFPAGTQVALVRQMLAIDENGEIVPTKITEMIQSRVYLKINKSNKDTWRDAPMQAFHEIRFQRERLFNGKSGGLTEVKLSDPKYKHFFARGEEHQFEAGPTSLQCIGCHRGNGIHSLNTYAFGHGIEENLAPKVSAIEPNMEAYWSIKQKQRRYDWGLLRGLWE